MPAFKKYDQDDSGAIDKGELGQMLKDLGNELDEEKLQEALNDLDINKDGVVDLDEFKGWWFSGMKSFSTRRRTLLKVSGGVSKFSAELKGAAADIASNPKTKSH